MVVPPSPPQQKVVSFFQHSKLWNLALKKNHGSAPAYEHFLYFYLKKTILFHRQMFMKKHTPQVSLIAGLSLTAMTVKTCRNAFP